MFKILVGTHAEKRLRRFRRRWRDNIKMNSKERGEEDTFVFISYVHEVIHQKCNKHHTRLRTHENPLLKTLLLGEENRRLKRNWPIDLI
jgi:hypothetical protein